MRRIWLRLPRRLATFSYFAATFSFEMWIIPRDHSPHFYELDHDKAVDLGGLLKLMLVKMSLQLNNPPYNFMVHSAPLLIDSTQLPFTHWFIQIVPQLTVMGGFELGTGCFINPVLPKDAAKVLREVLETFIMEWDEGKKRADKLLSPKDSVKMYVERFTELAVALGFDGWLVITCGILLVVMAVGNFVNTVQILLTKFMVKTKIKKDNSRQELKY